MNAKDILKIYDFQRTNLYLCSPNMKVGAHSFNSTLLMSDLTTLVNGNMFIQGEPGGGKTTGSSSAVNLFNGVPPEILEIAKVVGNDDQTEEKLIARPDIGQLNQGNEKNVWSYTVLIGPKIFDEFNRFHPRIQNVLFAGIDTGQWTYLNEIVRSQIGDEKLRTPIFLTANYPDGGNHKISPPMLDRFDISVDSPTISSNERRALRWNKPPSLEDKLISQKMHSLLRDKNIDYDQLQKELIKLSDQYKASIGKKLGLKLPTYSDLERITEQISALDFTEEASLFMDLAVNELNYCEQFGQVRSNETCPAKCPNSEYLCGKKLNGFSQRGSSSWYKYSRALAWITGQSVVGLEHVKVTLPYVIAHRLLFKQDYVKPLNSDKRKVPLYIHVAQKSLKALEKRFAQIKGVQKQVVRYLANGKVELAYNLAKGQEHPIFRDYFSTIPMKKR